MAIPPRVGEAVFGALARQLGLSPAEVERRRDDGLDALGLDSHGLMRVLLEIERALALGAALDLPDEALASPATLAAGVAGAAGA